MFEQLLPTWNETGVEPNSELKASGWVPGVKPSAQHMNWLFNRSYLVLQELQQKAGQVKSVNGVEPDASGNVVIQAAPVTSVNNKVGAVNLSASDVGAAPLDSPSFTGTPLAPTPAAGTNTTQLATTAFVNTAVATHENDYVLHPGYAEATNVGNDYAVTLVPEPPSLADGLCVVFKATATNTDAVTLSINNLGAKPILKATGEALAADDVKAGSIYTIRYNATTGNFILQGEGGGIASIDKINMINDINSILGM